MKVVYFKAENEKLNRFFNVDNSEDIPVIAGTALEVSSFLFHSAAKELNHVLDVFVTGNIRNDFYPGIVEFNSIEQLQWDSRELTVFTTALELPTELIELHNVHYLVENAGKIFQVSLGTYIGYVTSEEATATMPCIHPEHLPPIIHLDILTNADDYKRAVDRLVRVIGEMESPLEHTNNRVYGNPHVKGKTNNTTIAAPAYICENSHVYNSYVAPGSVIINSVIENTKVYNSVIIDSEVKDSELEGSLISGAKVRSQRLYESNVSYDSVLNARQI